MAHYRNRRAAAQYIAGLEAKKAEEKANELAEVYRQSYTKGMRGAAEAGQMGKLSDWIGGGFMDPKLGSRDLKSLVGKDREDIINAARARNLTFYNPALDPKVSKGITLSGMLQGTVDDPSQLTTLDREQMAKLAGVASKGYWWEGMEEPITEMQKDLRKQQTKALLWQAAAEDYNAKKAKEEAMFRSMESRGLGLGMGLGGAALAYSTPVTAIAGAAYSAYNAWKGYNEDREAWDQAYNNLKMQMYQLFKQRQQVTGRYGAGGTGFENLDVFGRPIA